MCYSAYNETSPCLYYRRITATTAKILNSDGSESSTIVLGLHLYLYCQLFIGQNTKHFYQLTTIYNKKLLFSLFLFTCYLS